MKPNLILLCGAPGTGCGRIQTTLSHLSAKLAEGGFYSTPMAIRRGHKVDLRTLIGEAARPESFGQVYLFKIDAAVARIMSDPRIHSMVLAQDATLGRPITSRRHVFYDGIDEVVRHLELALEHCDVQLRFIMRDFASFLPDYYLQQIYAGSRLTFPQFLDSIDYDSLTWETPVQALRRNFGTDRVKLFEYSDLGSDPALHVATVFPEIAPLVAGANLESSREGPAGQKMAEVYRNYNRVIEKLSPFPDLQSRLFFFGRDQILARLDKQDKSPGFAVPDSLLPMLREKYQLDLAALQPARLRKIEVEEHDLDIDYGSIQP